MTPDDGTSLSKFIPATCPPSLISLAPYVDSVDSLLYHARDKIFVASNIFENVSSFIHGRNIVNDARLGEKIKLTVSKSNDRWKFVRKKKKKIGEKLEKTRRGRSFINFRQRESFMFHPACVRKAPCFPWNLVRGK